MGNVTGGNLFFEVFGIVAFVITVAVIIFYALHLFGDVIPEFRNDYKRFKDSVYQRLHALDSRVRDLEDGVNLKKED